jgi:hypothetical protein
MRLKSTIIPSMTINWKEFTPSSEIRLNTKANATSNGGDETFPDKMSKTNNILAI